ncbi:hypothetical protein KCP70_21795 [Salmonella enterica subsp. enterica]|nr:hypothetical protein KCP70_21795 [Salmonella enterica subsp. enterica]
MPTVRHFCSLACSSFVRRKHSAALHPAHAGDPKTANRVGSPGIEKHRRARRAAPACSDRALHHLLINCPFANGIHGGRVQAGLYGTLR